MNVVNMRNEAIEIEANENSIVFSNKGEIDMRAVTTMGINAKDNKSAIGYFGTGLKYAVAVLMRESQEMIIWSGKTKYEFTKNNIDFRGKQFEVILMNGVELPFTTELGKNWRVWQAYRELHCNCTDEFGDINIESGDIEGIAGKTIIICKGEQIEEAFERRGTIILDVTPFYSDSSVEISHGVTHTIFYKNIAAATVKHCLYTYNIQATLELTEDRTIKYIWYARKPIMNAVLKSNDRNFIKTILMAHEDTFERTFDFTDVTEATAEPDATFLSVVAELAAAGKGNKTARLLWKKHNRGLDDGTLRGVKNLSDSQQVMFDKSIELCKLMDFPVDNYPIIFTDELDYNTLGLAEDEKIFINPRCFTIGLKMLTSTLIEEYLHIRHGFDDESREMQNYLFDKMVEFGAELHGRIW